MASKISIRELKKDEYLSYSQINNETGTIFTSLEWLKLFKNVKVFGIFEKGNNLIGAFHYYIQKILFFTYVRNIPFTPYIGPFISLRAKKLAGKTKENKTILKVIASFFTRLNYHILSLSFHHKQIDTIPFIRKNYKVVPNYTYILNLSKSYDELWEDLDNDKRNMIRKGEKDRIIIKKEDNYHIVEEFVLNTLKRKGSKTYHEYLKKILFYFSDNSNSYAFVAYFNNKPISMAFCLYDNHTAYYLFGGYNKDSKHNAAGSMIIWEAIKYAKLLKLNYFDFEGSMIPEVENFFIGFGGKLTPYFKINKAKLHIEILLKFFKRDIF